MKVLILCSLIIGLFGFTTAQAEQSDSKIVKVSVAKAYIPHGFDNNDVTKIVVEGFFPNTCYKLKKQEKEDVSIDPDTKQIKVTQRAYKYDQMCLMVVVPFNQTIEVGQLKNIGDYSIMDTLTSRSLGVMPVAKSETSGPDDFTYATINDAYVGIIETDERKIILEGQLPGSCWELTSKRAFLDGRDVLTVLPIMNFIADDDCDDKPVKFVTSIPLPELTTGRYLLNVRSLNGQAVNKLFDVNRQR